MPESDLTSTNKPPKIFDLHVDGTNRFYLTGKPLSKPHTGEEVKTRDGKTNMDQVSAPGMIGRYSGALANAFPNVVDNGESRAPTPDEFFENYRTHVAAYEQAVNEMRDDIALVGSQRELTKAVTEGKMAWAKSIEGLYIPLNNSGLKMLEDLAHDGVRNFGIMWNWENGIGRPHLAERENDDTGLTSFGIDVIQTLRDIPGVIIDTSHSSAQTAADIMNYARPGQVIASHTASRELNPHTRNLPHDIAMAIGEKGMIGVAFYAPFVKDPASSGVSAKDVVKHILYYKKILGGTAHLGLGTDMGGMAKESMIPGMETVTNAGTALYREMLASREITEEEIPGIFGGNALRYLVGALPEK